MKKFNDEESKKTGSSSSKNPSVSENVNSSTSESNATLRRASNIVEFDSNLTCETIQNEQANESAELSAKDAITKIFDKSDEIDDASKQISATSFNVIDLLEATTSQDNRSFYTDEASALHTNKNKIKRSISKNEVLSGTSEKSDDSSDKVSINQQKLNETRGITLSEETSSFLQADEGGLNIGRTIVETKENEKEQDKDKEKDIPDCLKIKSLPSKWHIVSEVLNREIGRNSLFQRRFCSSLYAIKRIKISYTLSVKHQDLYPHFSSIRSLNFNQKGNLLANASNRLIYIWDWSVKELRRSLNCHTSKVLQIKWLPSNIEEHRLVTCGFDGQIHLWNLEYNNSKKLAQHDGVAYKLAMHPETPDVFFSVGSDAKVFSIDIRESNPNELLQLYEDSMAVPLYSIDFNPFDSNEFCISGLSCYVNVYDRRNVQRPLYKFCPNHLLCRNKYEKTKYYKFVFSAKYNHNGTEILAAYDNNFIYLFDKLTLPHPDYSRRYKRGCSVSQDGINFFGPKSEYVFGSNYGHVIIWDKNTEAMVSRTRIDNISVICVERHPHYPFLAAGGWNSDVKILMPS